MNRRSAARTWSRLTSVWKAPAPYTPGSVFPLKASDFSRAPVATRRTCGSMSTYLSPPRSTPTFLSLNTARAVLFAQIFTEGSAVISSDKSDAISIPRVPACAASIEPKKRCVCRTSFPPSRSLSSINNTSTPRLPSSAAADIPAGPPPRIRTVTLTVSIACIAGMLSICGRRGSSSIGSMRIPGRTSVMHDFTGRSLAITRHWEHCPLAQKIPCGAPSFG